MGVQRMSYIPNPKTSGSGIICGIPQPGRCPNNCTSCFFQSGRSYLEPLAENLPNMPTLAQAEGRVLRVNDGNDSHHCQSQVVKDTLAYPDKFYNTACPSDLEKYPGPVVLTLNPGTDTDEKYAIVSDDEARNLMAVRFRINTWNADMAREAAEYYAADLDVAVFMTWMAYHNKYEIPETHLPNYTYRRRTMNAYWAIHDNICRNVMEDFEDLPRVYLCGELGRTKCRDCGNCLREYYRWKESQ